MHLSFELEILIPAKNEAATLPRLLARIHTSLTSAHISYRVILIDDHSTDSTPKVARQLATQYPLLYHRHTGAKGKAFALLSGAALTHAPWLAMIDADLEYPPEALPQLFQLAQSHGVAVGNRTTSHSTRVRALASRFNRHFVGRLVLGYKCDIQSGLKVFPREVLTHLNPQAISAWAIDLPLLHTATLLGHRIASQDITFTPRTQGESKCRAELSQAITQIVRGAVRIRLSKRHPLILSPTSSTSSIGAGVVHKRQRFITHSQLPHHHSALVTLSPSQKFFLFSLLCLLVASVIVNPLQAGIAFVGILSVIYFSDTLFSFFLVLRSFHSPPELSFSPQQLAHLDTVKLPFYTVMCPLYKEKAVLPAFVASISQLNWPKSRLEVLLLLEENDTETISAAQDMSLPSYIKILIVPHSQPKTKPKACNYGLAHAKGEYVVVFDAEDKPHPDQLKVAYLGFKHSSPQTACLQAKLNYYNPHQNGLTRLFTAEYSLWFDVILPGLQSINTTIPLGGTSNHFKTSILKHLHGWDAFNVTEDCDLGCRLFKQGYTTGLIDSITLEEANSNVGNWLRQRSRWIKGYMQTYFVHTRGWFSFARTRGIHAFIFHLIIGLRISFMLINPILWIATLLYFTAYSVVGPTLEALYPSWIFYLAGTSLVFGNFLYLYYYMIGAAKRGHWSIVKFVFLVPIYWLLVSLAALKAFYQLLVKPHFWEKTHHGLHLQPARVSAPPVKSSRSSWYFSPAWLRQPGLLSASFLILSSGLGFFLNFLYNVYLSRSPAVSLSDFGLIGLISSFNYILQIPIGALGATMTYRSGYLFGKYGHSVKAFWLSIRRKTFRLSLLCLALWLILSPLTSSLFHTNGLLPLLLYSPGWIIFSLAAIDTGYLSGSHRFKVLGLLTVLEAFAKLVLTVLLIELGFTHLIYATVPVSAAIVLVSGWVICSRTPSVTVPERSVFPARFFFTSVLNRFASLAFLSLDVIVAKALLAPEAAGEYALISVVGKMVYFGMSLFNQFNLPVISRVAGAGKSTGKVFVALLSLSSIVGLLSYIAVGLLGHLVVPLMFGTKSASILAYLPAYTLAMVIFSMGRTIVEYHQIHRRFAFSVFAFVMAPLLLVSMYLAPHTVNSTVHSVLLVSAIYLAGILFMHVTYGTLRVIFNNLYGLVGLFTKPFRFPSPSRSGLNILVYNWYDIKHVWAGGAEIYIHALAKEWVKAGHRVTMFTGNDLHHSRREVIDGIEVIRRGGLYTVALWGAVYYLLMFRGKFDVVVDIPKGVPFFTPLFVRKPIICHIHQVHQEMFRAELRFPLKQLSCFLEAKLMPFVYRHVQIVAVSESTKKAAQDIGLGKFRPIEVVVPGVEITPSHVAKTPYPSLLYLGRLRPYKSVDLLLKAASQLRRKYRDLQVVIAGTGEDRARLTHLAHQLHLGNSVKFTGFVSEAEKAVLFTQSWVAIQPSTVEGWGITNIEANLCNTPVVAANSDGLRDSVIDEVTGLLFRPGDEHDLQRQLNRLLSNPALREKLTQAALIRAKSFNWPASARKFLSIIQYHALPVSDLGWENRLLFDPIRSL